VGLFSNSKKKLLEAGVLAPALLKDVRDTGVTVNNSPQVKLIFQVNPEGGEPFEASLSQLVSRVNIPQPGLEVFVRYDPANRKKIVIDQQAIADYNTKADAKAAETASLALPADLASNGIPGRAMITAVTTRGRDGELLNTDVTASIRLVDGTPPFVVTFPATLAQETVRQLQSGNAIVPFSIRVDPANRSRAALSPTEPVPVVPYDVAATLEGPETAKRSGAARSVTPLEIQRQYLRTPGGDEVYSMRVRLDNGKEVLVGTVLVPTNDEWLLKVGKTLPAKVLASDESVLAIDWDAARRVAGALAG
jgi:hypothetical protein